MKADGNVLHGAKYHGMMFRSTVHRSIASHSSRSTRWHGSQSATITLDRAPYPSFLLFYLFAHRFRTSDKGRRLEQRCRGLGDA
jgi:hypothetical protein